MKAQSSKIVRREQFCISYLSEAQWPLSLHTTYLIHKRILPKNLLGFFLSFP